MKRKRALVQEIVGAVSERVRPIEVEAILERGKVLFVFKHGGVKVHDVEFASWELEDMGVADAVIVLEDEGLYAKDIVEGVM